LRILSIVQTSICLFFCPSHRDLKECFQHEYTVVQKTAQSLWHHNFATVRYRVTRFPAKCSEKILYITKVSALPLASELFKNSINLDTVVNKTCHFYFLNSCLKLADFNNFWHATLRRNLAQNVCSFGHLTSSRYTTL